MNKKNQKKKFQKTKKPYQIIKHNFKKLIKNPNRFNLIPKSIPLICQDDFEYGFQIYNDKPNYKMYYLRFYKLMMLDFDGITFEILKDKLQSFMDNGFVFMIYQTFNGYHAFILNNEFMDLLNFLPLFIVGKLLSMKELSC